MKHPVFIGVDEVAAQLAQSPSGLRFIEVRRDHEVVAQHLPGAVVATLSGDLSDTATDPTQGKRPLPDITALQSRLRRWGITRTDQVVVYEGAPSFVAARAWWVLRWAGLERVSILDGGLPAWLRGGHPIGGLAAAVAPSDIAVSAGHLDQLDAERAAAMAARHRLIDARTADSFAAGHIPGARNVSSADTLTAFGTLRDTAALRELYGVEHDSTAPGFYCGGGVAAAHAVAVLAHLGVTAPLFVGSFSAWGADPARPITVNQGARR